MNGVNEYLICQNCTNESICKYVGAASNTIIQINNIKGIADSPLKIKVECVGYREKYNYIYRGIKN